MPQWGKERLDYPILANATPGHKKIVETPLLLIDRRNLAA
jgi:hypothetical protein